MSRIDEALKRLAGVATGEQPTPQQVLDRYSSEGRSRVDDVKRAARPADHKIANFVSQGPVPVPPPSPSPVVPKVPAAAAADASAQARRPDQPVVVTMAPEPEVEQLIDVRQIADYAGFVVRSVVRHKLLAAGTFCLVLGMTVVASLLMPKTYYVQVKLLAQRNAVMRALSNPNHAVPWDADAPTRAAAETVLRRDNLISLVTQTDLVNEWERRRAPFQKFKDWVRAIVTRHTPTADERLEMLIGRLENQMQVFAGPVGDGTVTIELFWPDAEMAYRLVERAQQAFLEARQVAETSAITESIAILERYSTSLHDDVNRTLSELDRAQATEKGPQAARTRLATRRPAAASIADVGGLSGPDAAGVETLAPDPEVMRLKNQLSDKRQELNRIEQERHRSLSELQQKLAALQTVYTSSHPSVVTLQQNIATFQHESPQVVALQNSIEQLESKYDELAAADTERLVRAQAGRRPAASAAPVLSAAPAEVPVLDPPTPARPSQASQFASLRLRTELGQLQSILERTDGARIELAVSEAAFKYRYTVITPAQVPRDPAFPNLKLILMAGVLASFLLAVGIAVGTDMMSNRILEPWQVERQLGLPILGTVRLA